MAELIAEQAQQCKIQSHNPAYPLPANIIAVKCAPGAFFAIKLPELSTRSTQRAESHDWAKVDAQDKQILLEKEIIKALYKGLENRKKWASLKEMSKSITKHTDVVTGKEILTPERSAEIAKQKKFLQDTITELNRLHKSIIADLDINHPQKDLKKRLKLCLKDLTKAKKALNELN